MRHIPARFTLMGHEITVELRDDLLESANAYGVCHYHEHRIELQVPTENHKISKSHLFQTFWHEFAHMALYNMGYTDLAADEVFIDQLGQVLHQFHKTKSYR